MTPEDRELLQTLRREQLELQHALARLDQQLREVEARANGATPEISLPPLPIDALPELPPIPQLQPEPVSLPSLPVDAVAALPSPQPVAPRPSFEFQLGRWLTRVGAIFLVLFVVFSAIWANAHYHLYERLGALGKLGIIGLVSAGAIFLGQRIERKKGTLVFWGRTVMAAGLAALYFTFYAAHELDHLRVIHSPLKAGLLLLLWSAYVFLLADRRKSQTFALFAIALAYFSTSINPIGRFTLSADLVLAATAVLFFLRNGWVMLSYFSLFGTYFALLRRIVVDENGEIIFYASRPISFAPLAAYLACAWLIFTAAVLFSYAATFRGGKRLAFLSLNNGALAGLLALSAHLAGYDLGAIAWTLLASGTLLLLTSTLIGLGRNPAEAHELFNTYVAQGLALLTAGLIALFTGITRGVLLAVETFFLGAAGAFSRNLILQVAASITAFFASFFLIWKMAVYAHHPWLLGLGGALVMGLNAWWSRCDLRHDPQAREKFVPSSFYYCLLSLGLVYAAMSVELSEPMLPPALAWMAVALTFAIYLIPLYELPPTAQIFLLAAQTFVLFPAETGEALPWWTAAGVAAATLLLLTWWSRQRAIPTGPWIVLLNCVYALALVGLAYHAIRPQVSPQGWMISASLLSVAFLLWGAFTRVWPLAAMGQVFLVVASIHFYFPPAGHPWAWWAAAAPVVVAFATGRAVHGWLLAFPEITGVWRGNLRALGSGYLLLALALFIGWISTEVPAPEQISDFLLIGTIFLAGNIFRESAFGIRCSFVLSAVGMLLAFKLLHTNERLLATFINGFALLAFLVQPALLRRWGKNLIYPIENWVLILLSSLTGWLFVSAWVVTRIHPNYLTIGWTLYALFLFLFGLLVQERRQRWCGLALLVLAILRVGFYDIWGFSGGYRVLTLFVLTIVTLGLGYIIIRFADRLKTWL